MRVRYGKPIKVTTLLSNSLFANDLYTDWVSYRQTTSISNSIATCTRGAGTYGALFQDVTNLPGTQRYFYYVKMRALDIVTSLRLQVNTTTSFSQQVENPVVNQWYEFYGMSNVTNTSLRFEAQCFSPENGGTRYQVTTPIIIDLTSVNLNTLTRQDFYDRYNKYFPAIASGEEITIDDKSGQISYDKPIILKSLFGNQSDLSSVAPSQSGTYVYLGKDKYSTLSAFNINTNVDEINIPIISGHKYILVVYQNTSNNYYNMVANPSADKWKWTAPGTYISNKIVYAYYTPDSNIILKNFYQTGSLSLTVTKDFFIDLTDTFGVGNEPTATEFYNKYKGYFLDLCKGKQIVIGKGKVTGGSSDIYYGYNQFFGGLSSGNECTESYDSANDTYTLTASSSTTHTYFGLTCYGDNYSAASIQGHKVLCIANIIDISISSTFSYINFTWALSSVTDRHDSNQTGLIWGIGTWGSSLNQTFVNAVKSSGTFTQGDYFKVKDVQIIDLTDWFGVGKEPTTLAQFREKFTKNHYGHCSTPIKLTRYQIEALPSYWYNQLVQNGDFSSGTANWNTISTSKAQLSVSNNICTFKVTGIPTNYYDIAVRQQSIPNYIAGHKYLCRFELKVNQGSATMIAWFNGMGSGAGGNINHEFTASSSWSDYYFIATCIDDASYRAVNIGFKNIPAVNDSFDIKNIQYYDLTDWYGVGNEPTTIAEFKATFPNRYYLYSKKRLLNKYMINKLIN